MKPPPLRFDDLLYAFEFVSAGPPLEYRAYLSIETGVIHYHTEFDESLPDNVEDSEQYIPIPHKSHFDLGRRLALDFAKAELLADLDYVHDIFRRKGAYARFKTLLERRGKLQQWHECEESRKRQALREWCHANGVEICDQ